MAGTAGPHSGQIIRKGLEKVVLSPHLLHYDRECAIFTWDNAPALLDGLPGGQCLNIAHEAVDRHAAGISCTASLLCTNRP